MRLGLSSKSAWYGNDGDGGAEFKMSRLIDAQSSADTYVRQPRIIMKDSKTKSIALTR